MDVAALRAQFPVLERIAYLNTGTDGPVPAPALAAAQAELAAEVTDGRVMPHFERRFALQAELRAGYARLIGAPVEEVALTTSTSDGLGRLLAGLDLGPGDELITSDQEHPGLIGPLRAARDRGATVRSVPFSGLADAVGPRTRLVAASHVSWVSGELAPAALAQAGVPVILDGAQGAGAVPVDVRALGCAAYAGSGQKWLCGADGTGFLWVDPAFAEQRARGRAELRLLRGRDPRAGLAAEDDGRALRHAVARARGRGAVARPRSACSRRPAGRRSTSARPPRPRGSPPRSAERGRTVAPRAPGPLVAWEDADAEAHARPARGRGRRRAQPAGPRAAAGVGRRLERRRRPRPAARRARASGPRFVRAGSAADSPAGPDRGRRQAWALPGCVTMACRARSAPRRRDRRLPHRGGRRPRRHGHRVPRDAALARPAGRRQADRPGPRHRPRLPRALRARVARGRGDRPPERDPGLRGGRGGGPPLPRDALRERDRPAGAARARAPAGARPRRERSRSRSAPRWTPRTPPASCTATSSRPTCCSAASTPTSPTSASPSVIGTDTRLTTTGHWIGTADFMAPEQFQGDGVDARADVYALGCVLYTARDGRDAVPARDGAGDDARAPARPAAATVRDRPRRAGRLRSRDRPRAGQGPRRPLPVGGRPGPRRPGGGRGPARDGVRADGGARRGRAARRPA